MWNNIVWNTFHFQLDLWNTLYNIVNLAQYTIIHIDYENYFVEYCRSQNIVMDLNEASVEHRWYVLYDEWRWSNAELGFVWYGTCHAQSTWLGFTYMLVAMMIKMICVCVYFFLSPKPREAINDAVNYFESSLQVCYNWHRSINAE